MDCEFLCLTDMVDGVERLNVPCAALAHDWPGTTARLARFDVWPGFWSKIEVYRVSGPCLYLDLDVIIVGDLSPLLEQCRVHELIICADFWIGGPHAVNSSVVGWRGDAAASITSSRHLRTRTWTSIRRGRSGATRAS